MIRPALDEAKKLAEGYTVLPIALEILSDQKTPIELLRIIRQKSECCFILESVGGNDNWGRYSFLGYDPAMTLYATGESVTVKNGTLKAAPPIDMIRDIISRTKSPRLPWLPPFTGGLVGYFAYDAVQYFMTGLKLRAENNEGFRDFHLMLMDKIIAFDHFKQKIYIIKNIPTEDLESNYQKGVEELRSIEKLLFDSTPPAQEEPSSCGAFEPAFTENAFKDAVAKVKHHIVEGDIFQAVISNRFKAPFKGSLINTYRVLRTLNPSPYMVYMRLDDMEIACSSPETLVALRDGEISSFPLAGTRPRGKTEEEDAALIESLLQDEKELAEHDMLVDLARNDIGKVSSFGSVKVREHRQIKLFSHVSHIASRVTGEIRKDLDAIDVIAAALPAGTLSGAPKKRACEIIDAVEDTKRGIYGGAIGYIDFAGNMDMCIGIRMAFLKDGYVHVQAGAGIVAASVPESEYQETQNKAQAVMEALKRNGEV
ncbi:MAG: anthranilate synthase component I family protein [Alphaproteobacteria bacterium]|nr:anthranilate synthase component I family protein [Alphaproteobacteria bacterium]